MRHRKEPSKHGICCWQPYFWLFKQHLLLRLHWELAISFTSVFLRFRIAILSFGNLVPASDRVASCCLFVPGALLVRAGPPSHVLAWDFTVNRDIAVCRCSASRVVWTGIRGLTAFLTRPQTGRGAVELTFSTLFPVMRDKRHLGWKYQRPRRRVNKHQVNFIWFHKCQFCLLDWCINSDKLFLIKLLLFLCI